METLITRVTSAFRERVSGTIRWSEAWHDLDEAGRVAAFEATQETRALEAAFDSRGLSTTAHAVLGRIGGTGP